MRPETVNAYGKESRYDVASVDPSLHFDSVGRTDRFRSVRHIGSLGLDSFFRWLRLPGRPAPGTENRQVRSDEQWFGVAHAGWSRRSAAHTRYISAPRGEQRHPHALEPARRYTG